MSLETFDCARGRWKGIFLHFGVDPRYLTGLHVPCPLCSDGGGKDRFRFEDENGSGSYFCSVCNPGYGIGFLMKFKGWDFGKAAREVRALCGVIEVEKPKEALSEDRKRAFMVRIFKESSPVTKGDPVWKYLERRCGDVSRALHDIRFHKSLHHSTAKESHPAMLAFMGWNPDTRKFSGIHRTYLTIDGLKANVDPVRMTYGEVGDVRLGMAQETLGIAEGIETALCASQLFGIPVWSAISEGGLKVWNPPEGVRSVVVFGDNDKNYVGQAAAFDLAKRLRLKNGLAVEVRIPSVADSDWADAWVEAQKEKVA